MLSWGSQNIFGGILHPIKQWIHQWKKGTEEEKKRLTWTIFFFLLLSKWMKKGRRQTPSNTGVFKQNILYINGKETRSLLKALLSQDPKTLRSYPIWETFKSRDNFVPRMRRLRVCEFYYIPVLPSFDNIINAMCSIYSLGCEWPQRFLSKKKSLKDMGFQLEKLNRLVSLIFLFSIFFTPKRWVYELVKELK